MAQAAEHTVDVRQTLTRFGLLTGVKVSWQPLPGGLSHHVYLVRGGSSRYVLRVLDAAVSAAGLGIEPARELANTRTAVHSGVGPDVLGALDDPPAVLLEYIAGQTLSAADIPGRLPAVAAACRRLHAGPAFGNDFDIVAKRAQLLQVCARYDLTPPAGYRDREGEVAAIAAALGRQPLPPVPCHNDLLAENFIAAQDGRLRIVDYQLSGNNDPTFELGDIAAEADLDPDQTVALAQAYFGTGLTRALVARTRLQLILSNITWTLWFTVHNGLLRRPDSTFDYRAEAADKWGQACRDLDAPDFGALLDAAAARTTNTP
jgi:thiamine kinase-like enzyme